jgi:hypothetical protein
MNQNSSLSLGFSLLVGAGAERVLAGQRTSVRSKLVKTTLLLLLALFAAKTWTRNQDWRSRESLFT